MSRPKDSKNRSFRRRHSQPNTQRAIRKKLDLTDTTQIRNTCASKPKDAITLSDEHKKLVIFQMSIITELLHYPTLSQKS